MSVCCCSLAGTAACQHCRNNPFATDVWTNRTVTVDHIEARPFGDGLDVCPVCGKPSTIGKPTTNADKIRSMRDEEMAELFIKIQDDVVDFYNSNLAYSTEFPRMKRNWLGWLKQEVECEE